MLNLLSEYSASEAADLAGISVDNLRDWRRRRLIEEYGVAANKRSWKYSILDILGMWNAIRFSGPLNLRLSRMIAEVLVIQIQRKKLKLPLCHYDYAVDEITFTKECLFISRPTEGPETICVLDNISQAPDDYLIASVLNFRELYAQIPQALKEAIFVADPEGKTETKEIAKDLAQRRGAEVEI